MTSGPGKKKITTRLPEPSIVPRSEHPISRKNIDREALKVMHRLRDAGYTAYLVGGGVRDLYLHKTPKDFDISTNARPGQLRKLFRNSRIIGRRFRLVQVFFHGGKIIEVSTLRCRSEYDIKDDDKVLPSNNTFGNEEEDAFRRDLTINSLFYEIENFSIIDYTGGVEDLKNGIVRIVGNPDRRITRDPARMMRAIRHAARSGFVIEKNTWEAIIRHKAKLNLCPVSRTRDELFKDLRGGASKPWVRLAINSGLFFIVLPCYETIIPAEVTENTKTQNTLAQLLNIFEVIDRLQADGQLIPDHMLLALILLPWAQAELNIMKTEYKGAETFAFSRKVRDRVDEILSHLNIKRATREAITSLLINLSLFKQNDKTHHFPKWLTRKSYFNEGLQFYRIYQESQGGSQVASLRFSASSKTKQKSKKRSHRHESRSPAFCKNRGGIFGFKQ